MLRAGYVQCLEVSKGAEVTNSKRSFMSCPCAAAVVPRPLVCTCARVTRAAVTAVGLRFHLWSCDVPNLKLTIKENFCRTALHVMLRAEAKAQVQP